MLGPGRYVFKDGSQQIGEYHLEKVESNNSSIEQDENGRTVKSSREYITKWKCKKRILANSQKGLVPEEV